MEQGIECRLRSGQRSGLLGGYTAHRVSLGSKLALQFDGRHRNREISQNFQIDVLLSRLRRITFKRRLKKP